MSKQNIDTIILEIKNLKLNYVLIEQLVQNSDNKNILDDINKIIELLPLCEQLKEEYIQVFSANELLSKETENMGYELIEKTNDLVKMNNKYGIVNNLMESLKNRVKELDESLNDKDNMILELNERIFTKTIDISTLKEINQKKEDIIEDQKKMINILEKRMEGLNEKMEFRNKENKVLQEEIDRLNKKRCHIL
jgi:chromosome segregation ATPase